MQCKTIFVTNVFGRDLNKILDGIGSHLHTNTAAIVTLFVLLSVTGVAAAYFVIRDLRAAKQTHKRALKEMDGNNKGGIRVNLPGVQFPLMNDGQPNNMQNNNQIGNLNNLAEQNYG